jgi:hypothetical protein
MLVQEDCGILNEGGIRLRVATACLVSLVLLISGIALAQEAPTNMADPSSHFFYSGLELVLVLPNESEGKQFLQ